MANYIWEKRVPVFGHLGVSTDPFWSGGKKGFFHPFVGGCGIGRCNSLEEAKQTLLTYLNRERSRRIKDLTNKLFQLTEIVVEDLVLKDG